SLMDRLFRRIGKLDDESLIQLETMTRVVDKGGPMPDIKTKGNPAQVRRRYFVTSLLAGGILAASAGGVAAGAPEDDNVKDYLRQEGWLPTATPAAPTATAAPSGTPTLPPEARTQISTLQNQLASAIQERDGLQQQVTTVSGQLSDLQAKHDLLNG